MERMIPCRFCDRSRESRPSMVGHLVYWHNVPENVARNLVDHPSRPVPDWVRVVMDERSGKLLQLPME